MAISLITEPQEFQPVNNPIEFVFDSGNKAACDFAYVADLYVNGNFVITLKAFPDGDNGYGTFRIERVLKDYVSWTIHSDLIGFANNQDSILEYYLDVYERSNASVDCTGAVVDGAVSYTSTTKYAWNGALSYVQFANLYDREYIAYDVISKPMLNATEVSVRENIEFTLYTLQYDNSGSSIIDHLTIVTYNGAGLVLGTYTIANSVSAISTYKDLCLAAGVGTAQLNAASLASGVQPVITDDVVKYEIWFSDSGNARISKVITFNIDRECNKYLKYTLFWLNRLGGIDSYTFTKNHTRDIDISRKEYHKPLPGSYSEGDRGKSILNIDANERFSLNSSWLTEKEAVWLEELFTSPHVYLENRENTSFNITGVVYEHGTANFQIDYDGFIPIGTQFNYTVNNGAAIGMANSGTGTIVGFFNGGYETDVVASINAGAIITGIMTILIYDTIPVIVTSPTYPEKRKDTIRMIRHTVDIKPSYSVNVQ